ncbi:hypothetical protein B9Z55_023413 [Caenorhabditis nigoni]|uniref:Uncharacterized protein n=1 Tax=Caenorhabditis nigoni TaxID=1611254 RepID=A0A2G5SPR8_9PELO|nr:hypothetical protein B9Z55_023413 [Caenorhabditis nigoni]
MRFHKSENKYSFSSSVVSVLTFFAAYVLLRRQKIDFPPKWGQGDPLSYQARTALLVENFQIAEWFLKLGRTAFIGYSDTRRLVRKSEAPKSTNSFQRPRFHGLFGGMSRWHIYPILFIIYAKKRSLENQLQVPLTTEKEKLRKARIIALR